MSAHILWRGISHSQLSFSSLQLRPDGVADLTVLPFFFLFVTEVPYGKVPIIVPVRVPGKGANKTACKGVSMSTCKGASMSTCKGAL